MRVSSLVCSKVSTKFCGTIKASSVHKYRAEVDLSKNSVEHQLTTGRLVVGAAAPAHHHHHPMQQQHARPPLDASIQQHHTPLHHSCSSIRLTAAVIHPSPALASVPSFRQHHTPDQVQQHSLHSERPSSAVTNLHQPSLQPLRFASSIAYIKCTTTPCL